MSGLSKIGRDIELESQFEQVISEVGAVLRAVGFDTDADDAPALLALAQDRIEAARRWFGARSDANAATD